MTIIFSAHAELKIEQKKLSRMKIIYDKSVDALNFSLRTGIVAKTLELAPEVLLDVDENGRPLYLEILGASEKIGKKNFEKVTIGNKSFPLPVFA